MAASIESITHLHSRDQSLLSMPVEIGCIPLSYDAITIDWLNAVLCKGREDVAVSGFELGPRDDGSSNRRKIGVRYTGQSEGFPKKLFCKATHDLQNRVVLGLSGGAMSEMIFYNRFQSALDIKTPACWYAEVDRESFNSLIMLDDISDTVMSFCDHTTEISRERAESQIDLLAMLHGTVASSDRLSNELKQLQSWSGYFQGTKAFGLDRGCAAGFLEAESVIPSALFARAADVWPATERSVAVHAEQFQTLAHGDVHLKNWYVDGDGNMGLADWQCCHRGSWPRDLAYTLSTALTVDNRRDWERELLQRYIEQLHANGGPELVFEHAWDLYRGQMLAALAWWTVTLAPAEGMPDMQPRDITLEFIHRIATACDDLDSIDAV